MSVTDSDALADWRSIWQPLDPAVLSADGAYPA
jgi:hypothetical protein